MGNKHPKQSVAFGAEKLKDRGEMVFAFPYPIGVRDSHDAKMNTIRVDKIRNKV